MAIDLPGFGKTKVYDKEATEDKGSYLAAVIDSLTPDEKPVIITPSMSGSFIIPLLARSPEKVARTKINQDSIFFFVFKRFLVGFQWHL